MSILRGKFTDVARVGLQGEVTVWAVLARPSASDPQAVVTRAVHHAALVDGAFETGDLEPGPARISLRAGGIAEEYRIDIPADGDHELADLLETSFEYEPVVVQRAQAAAAAAAKSARDAEAAAGRVGTAERVLEAEQSAQAAVESIAADRAAVAEDRVAVAGDRAAVELARDDAVRSVNEAVSEASDTALADINAQVESAKGFRDEAQTFRDQAEQHASTAGAKASAADASASAAGESATAAGEKATAAAASAEASEQARVAGEALLVQGRSLAEQGAADADRAEAARSQAEGFARTSGEQATLAEQHAREAAASAESAKQGAPEGGWTKAQLHVNVQAQLDKVDSLPTSQTVQSMIAGKADTTALQEGLAGKLDSQPVSENVTNSTLVKRTSEGKIKAANGSAADDAVTKSQLDTKLDKSPQAWSIYGRDDAGETMIQYSKSADANKIAVRETGGALQVGTPTDPAHAATKDYTDKLIQQLQSTVQQLQSRITALESTAVTSSDVRKIAKGTGSTSTTLYIEGV